MWVPLAAVLIVLLPALSAAQEPVKSFDQLDTRLKPGDTVYVTDAQGREVKGKIRELTPSALMLDNGGGWTVQSREGSRITQKHGHKTAKGALWGLVAGAAISVWPAVVAGTCHEEDCQMVALVIPVFLGAGAGIGAAVGATKPSKELVVYRAPSAGTSARFSIAPMISPRAKGVAVAFTF
jgi:hypothetical protein